MARTTRARPVVPSVGDRYARLTVAALSHIDARSRKWFVCYCDCGGVAVLHSGNLNSGNTKSCGCLLRESRTKRISVQHSNITAVIMGYKRHARDRGYSWNLSREQVEAIIVLPCHYCGLAPSNVKVSKNSIEPLLYSGIDRVDNTRGYVADNVVPCCAQCNRGKGNMTTEEFTAWIKRVAAWQK